MFSLFRDYKTLTRGFKFQYHNDRKLYERQKSVFFSSIEKAINTHNNIIISAESFWKLSLEEIQILKNYLLSLGITDIGILLYIRKPSDFYLSHIQQILKGSSTLLCPLTFRYPFINTINSWSTIFPNQLVVRPFDKSALHQACVVHDFLNEAYTFFGLPKDNFNQLNIKNQNTSLSAESIIILQHYRHRYYPKNDHTMFIETNKLVNELSQLPPEIKQTRPMLTKQLSSHIDSMHTQDLQTLQANYDIDFKCSFQDSNKISALENFSRVESIMASYDTQSISDILLYLANKNLSPEMV